MNFCYEETAEVVDGCPMGADRAFTARAEAKEGQTGSPVGLEPGVFGGHSVGPANRGGLALFARRVPFASDLLAAPEAVGRARRVAGCLACTARRARRRGLTEMGGSLPGR
jgi:hypothetical protein